MSKRDGRGVPVKYDDFFVVPQPRTDKTFSPHGVNGSWEFFPNICFHDMSSRSITEVCHFVACILLRAIPLAIFYDQVARSRDD